MLYADWRRPQETHVWEDGWRWSFTICASYRGDGCGTGAVTAHKTSEAALLLVGFIQMLLLLFFFFYSISHFQEIHRAHRSAGAQRPVRKSKNNPSRDLLRLETSIKTFLTWESDWHEGDLMEVARWQRHFLPTFSLDWHRGAFKRLDFLQ